MQEDGSHDDIQRVAERYSYCSKVWYKEIKLSIWPPVRRNSPARLLLCMTSSIAMPRYRSIGFQVALSAATITAWGLAAHVSMHSTEDAYRADVAILEADKILLASSRAGPDVTLYMASNLVPRLSLGKIESDVVAIARQRAMQVAAMSLHHSASSEREVGKTLLKIDAVADYAAFKGWLSDLQGRYSNLAVLSLSIRNDAADAARPNVQLTLVLYTRD